MGFSECTRHDDAPAVFRDSHIRVGCHRYPPETTRRDSDLPTVMPSSKKHEPVFKTKQPASSPDESAHTATDAAHICNESLALLRYGTFSGS